MENWCYARPAASSTSSASSPESRAAYMTSVNCVARGCGTAATSLPSSVLVNTQTRRAAPMEAPPPLSPPHPPRHPHPRPHQTPPPHLHRWAKKAPKPGTFSPFGNSPELEAMGSFAGLGSCQYSKGFGSICWIPELFAGPLCPQPLLPVSLLLRIFVTRSFHVVQCGTSSHQKANYSIRHENCFTAGRAGTQEAHLLLDNHQALCRSGAPSGSSLLLAWHTSMGFVGRGHIRV